jgi:uncharacterized protein (TIGR00369 family)
MNEVPLHAEVDLETAKQRFRDQLQGAGAFGTWLAPDLEHLRRGFCRCSVRVRPEMLRSGGTVAGPILMGLADIAMYGAVISVAPNGVDAATSDMTLHFLRRPAAGRLVAEATVVRGGRRLVVCDVMLFAEGDDAPVCHVTGSYALPGMKRG